MSKLSLRGKNKRIVILVAICLWSIETPFQKGVECLSLEDKFFSIVALFMKQAHFIVVSTSTDIHVPQA